MYVKRAGRPKVVEEMRLRIWAVDPGDTNNNSTLTVISMCIKDDMNQTLEELAERVAECKQRPVSECLAVLKELRKKGHLGYFVSDDERGFLLKKWEPGGARGRLRRSGRGRDPSTAPVGSAQDDTGGAPVGSAQDDTWGRFGSAQDDTGKKIAVPKKRGRKPKLRKWGKAEKAEYARAYYKEHREKILAQRKETNARKRALSSASLSEERREKREEKRY